MNIKRMAIIKTGMMRVGPTMGPCSLLVQEGNVCAATVLCAPAATNFPIGCLSTGRSTDEAQSFNSCGRFRLLLRPCRPLLLCS